MGKTNIFWGVTWLHVGTPQEFTTHLNKNSPLAHMESKLDLLGVAGKLVKYAIQLSKIKN
jgi:hypothetical protein